MRELCSSNNLAVNYLSLVHFSLHIAYKLTGLTNFYEQYIKCKIHVRGVTVFTNEL